MSQKTAVQQYRPEGTRNFIRVGDRVRVRTEGKHPMECKVQAIRVDEAGVVVEVDVVVCRSKLKGGGQMKAGTMRCFTPDRIERMAQTKNGERR